MKSSEERINSSYRHPQNQKMPMVIPTDESWKYGDYSIRMVLSSPDIMYSELSIRSLSFAFSLSGSLS